MAPEMVEDAVTQILVTALTGGAGAAFGWLAHRLRQVQDRSDERERRHDEEMAALKEGMTCTLKADLVEMHRRYVVEGEPCAVSEKDRAEETYHAYHALGGNGTGTELYRQIMEDAKVAGRAEWRAAHGA